MKYLRLLFLHQYSLPLRINRRVCMGLECCLGPCFPRWTVCSWYSIILHYPTIYGEQKSISVIPSEKSEDPGIERLRQVMKHMVIQVCFPPLKGSEP